MADIGRILLPLIGRRTGHLDRLPVGVAVEHFAVFLVEHLGAHFFYRLSDVLAARPDILQVDRLTVVALAQRLFGQINLHAARQRISHHQRRRGQPVGFHQRVNTPFEVAVARQHRAHGQIALFDRLLDRIRQRAGVTDAGGAAIPHQVEPQLFQIGGEFGAVEVVGYHFGSRRQRGFYPGFAAQPFLDGVFRQQAGRHHHARVGGVGAGGDRRDHHRAVAQFVLLPVQRKGFAVGIGLVPPDIQLGGSLERLRHIRQRNAILRAFRPGEAGFHG
ncbi:Uncharacterised protein [Serratia marcescens]|nr:Uncharacterised protein [Serratia marcescens]